MIIDAEFAELIPALTDEEFNGLEQSILNDGCRDALVVWNDTLIDDHNRYKICQKHNIPFKTIEKNFDSREDALIWIMNNQLSRRNLNNFQRIEIVYKCQDVIKAKAQERMYAGKANPREKLPQGQNIVEIMGDIVNSYFKGRARSELGKKAKVSGKTYEHAVKIIEQAPEELKQAVRSGEMSINKAYTDIKKAEEKRARDERINEEMSKPKSSNYVDIFTTDKKYRVIYADPPWAYNDKQDTEKLGGAVKHYPTMPLEEICALPVPAEKDAVLFLWTTSPMLEDAFKVINAWGFKYKSSFIWDKVAHVMGHCNSVRHEFLLICVRGSCTPDNKKLFDSVISI